ncbi:MAG: hypothetical protein HN509_06740 [Halobacteriovoraceae bacterium]|jgi:hypothetical protein|nr:hypothetical protein [Halobacteriovoraceae bacterium]MBT5094716.1 hypothetical protein [Halobacteriovoraceae bacterium]
MNCIKIAVFAVLISTSAFAKWSPWLPSVEMQNSPTQSGRWLRSLIHMHSVFSHDACDGKPQTTNEDGTIQINQKCLDQFKAALCGHHIDVIFLTEHRTHMAHTDFNNVLRHYQLDSYLIDGPQMIGGEISCPDFHQVKLFPGAENALMPLGLKTHPKLLPGLNMESTYGNLSPAASQNFKDAGALVGIPHLENERYSIERILKIDPDYLEIYNIHANIEQIYIKFNPIKIGAFLARLTGFLLNPLVKTDLAYLSFLKETKASMRKWAQLVAHKRFPGIMGSDIHRNVLKLRMKDGDRFDSHRRMIRWFSNYIYVTGEVTRESIMKSISEGRNMGVFEIFGSPNGFEFKATKPNGEVIEMGAETNFVKGTVLTVRLPDNRPKYAVPYIKKATSRGWVKVAKGKRKKDILTYVVKEPGVFKVDIRLRPLHMTRYMITKIGHLLRRYPWIYSNPIYLR